MGEAAPNLSGCERAAVLLLSLGDDVAAQVMQHMGPKDVQQVGLTMATMERVSRPMVEAVLDELLGSLEGETGLGIGNDDYTRRVLEKALGEKAGNLIDRIVNGGDSQGLDTLKWMDPRAVAEVIRFEHPQIVAIVLSHLDPEQAAAVLAELPETLRPEIVLRIASLDGVPPSALKELDAIVEKSVVDRDHIKSSHIGGYKAVADILNVLDSAVENEVLEALRGKDEELVSRITDLMFVFDDLVQVDDRGVQALLREISTDVLVVALKGAEESVKQKFLKNMSKRASEMLVDDMESKGPVRLSEVEEAQKEILTTARKMEHEGDLSLGGGGDEFV